MTPRVRILVPLCICLLLTLDGGRATASLGSAAPASPSSAAVVRRSVETQKGIAASAYLSSDIARVKALHVGWAYNWSAQVPASTPGFDSVPMLWGSGSVTPASIGALRAGARSGAYSELLGFNEPDSSSQSNLTPEEAADLWPELESTGLELGSPAPADPSDGWLQHFMAIAKKRGLRVDFIALHFYPDFTSRGAVQALASEIRHIHARYNLPIWITEIGSVDIRSWGEHMDANPTEARAVEFMTRMTDQFERMRGIVPRYSWFLDNAEGVQEWATTSMYGRDGRLTFLGKAYAALR